MAFEFKSRAVSKCAPTSSLNGLMGGLDEVAAHHRVFVVWHLIMHGWSLFYGAFAERDLGLLGLFQWLGCWRL